MSKSSIKVLIDSYPAPARPSRAALAAVAAETADSLEADLAEVRATWAGGVVRIWAISPDLCERAREVGVGQ